ncbi:hypothetical protein MOV08_05100 [Streptomyces yunnanensis]|uniref:Uncharacterized protein n=1 Tax=Streptomyces yunnanensis TaxID=156453 RepID=A0ABY8A1C1_9ACTN|nr:hypothetical protein [Streptomyces yunnanensis]WEB38739.1 hypothetical protein MOV08_05100 [Streptomyces yunnanensis]
MTAPDPFAVTSSPWEDTPTATPEASTEEKSPMNSISRDCMDINRVRVTLKGGVGYEAPWITIDGADIPDALKAMQDFKAELAELIEITGKSASFFHAKYQAPAKQAFGGGGGVKQPAPSAQPDRPANVPPHFVYREGVGKASGKPYKMWCSTDRNSNEKPIFV